MSFETSIALRYLAASRRRAHVALISTISMLGLAVGVAALVISLSLLSGFQDRIRAQMAQRTPHLRVSPARGAVLPDPDRVRGLLAQQIDAPVQWVRIIERMAADGVTHALEIGPGKVLAGLAKRISKQIRVLSVGDPAAIDRAAEFLSEA